MSNQQISALNANYSLVHQFKSGGFNLSNKTGSISDFKRGDILLLNVPYCGMAVIELTTDKYDYDNSYKCITGNSTHLTTGQNISSQWRKITR